LDQDLGDYEILKKMKPLHDGTKFSLKVLFAMYGLISFPAVPEWFET
jgi:hypothetical protein